MPKSVVLWATAVLIAPVSAAYAQSKDDAPPPAPANPQPATQAAPPVQADQNAPAKQAPPAKKPAAKDKTSKSDDKASAVQGITVTGQRADYKSSIDRRSYNISKDLQTEAGSLADALRNVPGVQVDVQGNLSLRGDSNVTILVDGKPSGMFQGQNRADALQQLPADRIERVEVMTNPSAAFKPDGSGGIINLITKKGVGAAITGSVRLNVGNEGRYNGGISGSYNDKKLSMSGSLNARRDTSASDYRSTEQVLDTTTGRFVDTTTHSHNANRNASWFGQGSIDYDLDDKNRLSADGFHYDGHFSSRSHGDYSADGGTGVLGQDFTGFSKSGGHWSGSEASGTYLHKFPGEEHEVSLRLSYDENGGFYGDRRTHDYTDPTLAPYYQDLVGVESDHEVDLKAEYKGPLPGDAKLVTGYELTAQFNSYEHDALLGTNPTDAQAQPGLDNLFRFNQQVHALYATYQKPFGDFTIMPGLRLEEVVIDLNQVTSAIKDQWSYFRVYPTLHLGYKLSDTQQLTASYSRRVQRPDPEAFNPFLVYNGPLSYVQGNPRLQPQTTASYEVGWEYKHRTTYFQATAFYRDTSDQFTSVTVPLSGGVLLNTQENLGSSRNGGVELVANGPLFIKTLTYNVSGDVFWNQIDASNLGYTGTRSDFSLSARATLNWQATKNDFLQMNAYGSGRRLTAQGYTGSSYSLNFGYRHKFNDRWSSVLTVQNPQGGSVSETVIDTPLLKQRSRSEFSQRAIYLGLRYALGAPNAHKPENNFDFGGGGGGPGPGGH